MSKSSNFKAWHLIVIVLGIAAVGYGGYRLFSSMGSKVPLSKSIYGIDVANGQVYEFKVGDRAVTFPAVSPDTGQRTVIPAGQDADGVWFLEGRFLSVIDGLGVEIIDVDRSTGKVENASDSIKSAQ